MSVIAINERFVPFYFGQDSALYGCCHLPMESRHDPAVLICQPPGHEYERCHRAMRQLGVQLARKGLAAMRFDYYGTGDSSGYGDETTLAQMRQDIQQAIVACRQQTGAQRLALVGLRLGATLAAQVASSSTGIDTLVLYAPVFDGQSHLQEWQNEQHVFDKKHSHTTQQARQGEILGFPVTETLHTEMNGEFSLELSNSSLKRVLILVNESEMASAALTNWMDTFRSHDVMVTVEAVENIAVWRREPMEAIVPIKPIRRIVKWITEN